MSLRIGEMAASAGCQVVTIRYYEKEGLLPAPERSSANYRLYGDADLERLRFILHCRRHGIKLEDIRKLLIFRDNPQRECGFVHDLVEKQLAIVEEQIKSLETLKKVLQELQAERACNRKGHCPILHRLNAPEDCLYCRKTKERDEPDSPLSEKISL